MNRSNNQGCSIQRLERGGRVAEESEPYKGFYAVEEPLVDKLKAKLSNGHKGKFKTIECSIMDIADDIAYSTYDVEDAFAAGFMTPMSIIATDDKLKEEIKTWIISKLKEDFPDYRNPQSLNIDDMNDALFSVFSSILDLDVDQLAARKQWEPEELATYIGSKTYNASVKLAKDALERTQFTSDLIGVLIGAVEVQEVSGNPAFWQVRPTSEAFIAIETLKSICYTSLINSPKFLAERRRAKHIIERIFDALIESGSELLPADWSEVYKFYFDDEIGKRRVVCDYVAGMTNRYCIEFYERLFGPEPPSIHKP